MGGMKSIRTSIGAMLRMGKRDWLCLTGHAKHFGLSGRWRNADAAADVPFSRIARGGYSSFITVSPVHYRRQKYRRTTVGHTTHLLQPLSTSRRLARQSSYSTKPETNTAAYGLPHCGKTTGPNGKRVPMVSSLITSRPKATLPPTDKA